MIPTFIGLGLIAGVFAYGRFRVLILSVVGVATLVALSNLIFGGREDETVGWLDALGAFGLAALNLGAGAAIGWGISEAFRRGGRSTTT